LLLPTLRNEFNPQVDEALTRLARLADENETIINELIEGVLERAIVRQTENEIVLDSSQLRSYSSALLREIFVRLWKNNHWSLREMGFEQWTTFVEFFCQKTGICNLRGNIVAEHNADHFLIRRK
jgi:hypothetical protein